MEIDEDFSILACKFRETALTLHAHFELKVEISQIHSNILDHSLLSVNKFQEIPRTSNRF